MAASGVAGAGGVAGIVTGSVGSAFHKNPFLDPTLDAASHETVYTVNMYKGGEGLGFSVGADKDHGIVIEHLRPGSNAATVGMRPGDRLTEVNGRDVSSASLDQAIDILRAAPAQAVVTLVFSRSAKQGAATRAGAGIALSSGAKAAPVVEAIAEVDAFKSEFARYSEEQRRREAEAQSQRQARLDEAARLRTVATERESKEAARRQLEHEQEVDAAPPSALLIPRVPSHVRKCVRAPRWRKRRCSASFKLIVTPPFGRRRMAQPLRLLPG